MSRTTAAQRRLLALAVGSQASISIASWGLGALGPELRDEFDLSAAALGALLATVFIGNALVLVPAGMIVDRIGPRQPLIVGGIASGALLVLAGLAGTAWLLGTCLFAYGVVSSIVAVAGTVSVFHGFDALRRGMALGVRQMAVSLGGLIAAGLLPGMAAIGGVRLSFITSGLLAGVFAAGFGLASPRGALAAGGGRARDFSAVIRTPGIPRLIVVALIDVTVLTSVLVFSVPAINDEGASTAVGAALFAIVSVSAMVARLTWGRVADLGLGTRRRATLRDVGLVATVGALLYWAATPLGPPVQLPVMAIFAFGAMGANGVIYLMAGELAGARRAGQAVGLMSMALFGGGALAAVPLGVLADRAGFTALWPTAALLAVLGVLVTLGLPRPVAVAPASAPPQEFG
ncbi:MAG TPA: MFS transporter [Miltoncostaeaceae bacterium]|nr:MFS transporter [Miltoncostaeaceae bacterium]